MVWFLRDGKVSEKETTQDWIEPLSSAGITAVFHRLRNAARIQKTAIIYVLRRTLLTGLGALNARFGWKPGSRMRNSRST